MISSLRLPSGWNLSTIWVSRLAYLPVQEQDLLDALRLVLVRQDLVDDVDDHLWEVLAVQDVRDQQSQVLLFLFDVCVLQALLYVHVRQLVLVVRDADERSGLVSVTHLN